jgi:competence protein ComEC
MLDRELTIRVTGWISNVEETPEGGRRVTLRVHHFDELRGPQPRAVRVTIRTRADALGVGDAISVLARLSPPSGPVQPGAYDFAEAAFYEGLGAYGFALGAASRADIGAPPLDIAIQRPVAAMRETIRARVEAALPGQNGHIAAALIMGDQNGISDDTQDQMRASGLGHVLSISGLHMVLVAGSVFWLLRALLALSPALALRRPIKKWAAAAALAVSAAYLAISGAAVATERSFIMLAIMLGAVLLDRRALTLRNVALAALAVLVLRPESVLAASFQMSFAATAALVAAYEVIAARPALALGERRHPIIEWLKRDAAGLVLTSLIAGLATAPFGIYQFQRLAPLTLVANVAAMPAISLMVMPAALATVVFMPFGLEAIPLAVLGWGLDWMNAVAATTASWSAGYGSVSAPSMASLLLAVAGFLWLTLWRERWRFAGLIPLMLAVPVAAATPHADILVNGEGSAAAVRGSDGRLRVLGSDSFTVENWLRADGDTRRPGDPSLAAGVACDRFACVMPIPGGTVSLVLRPEAFAEECRRATLVLSGADAPRECATHALIIDGARLRPGGAHALYRDGDGYRIDMAYPTARRPFMPPAAR